MTESNQPPKASDLERRRSGRIPFSAVVHYHVDGSEFINLSSNISSEGIFIKNFSPPPVGTELRITVRLPPMHGDVPIQLVGSVVRVTDGVGIEERGMGVEFRSVEAQSREAITFFVDQVYGVEDNDLPVKKSKDRDAYQYQPRPEDTLPLQSADREESKQTSSAEQTGPSMQKWVWGSLLFLAGLLMGGGLVILMFLVKD